VAVPPLCTATLGVTATTTIVVVADTCASAAPAVEAVAEMPRQTVDQILLLPGLRHLKSGAQLLQLGDGLRARRGGAAGTLIRMRRNSGNTCVEAVQLPRS
jgi:hypothetical protein